MSAPAVKPIPEGMHSLTPHLICAGAADAIKFYACLRENWRLDADAGR
jgi:PhnB protein